MIRTNVGASASPSKVEFAYTTNGVAVPTTTAKPIAIAFAANSLYAGVAGDASPYIEVLKNNGGTFTKLAQPAVIPTSYGTCIAMSGDGTYLALGTGQYNGILYLYKRSYDTYTKMANPAAYPTAFTLTGLSFSYDGVLLVYAQSTYGILGAYKRTNDTFAALTISSGLANQGCSGLSVSGDASRLAFSSLSDPYFVSYSISATYAFTQETSFIANLSPANGCGLSYDGRVLAIAFKNAPYLRVFRDNVELSVKGLPTAVYGEGSNCTVSSDGKMLVMTMTKEPYAFYYAIGKDCVLPVASASLNANGAGANGIAFSADGLFAATPYRYSDSYGIQRQVIST